MGADACVPERTDGHPVDPAGPVAPVDPVGEVGSVVAAGPVGETDPRGREGQEGGTGREDVGIPVLRVVVADDQAVVREGIVTLLGLLPGVEVVGAAQDGAEAVALTVRLAPDVVLMDLRMPRCDGVEATRRIREGHPGTEVVVLTTYADDDSLFPALRAGARGYLTKDADGEEIVRALRDVTDGRAGLSPTVQRRLIEQLLEAPGGSPAPQAEGLTERETEVIALVADGLSNQEIANRLRISTATVKTHINNLFAKTGVRDRAQAVRYAYRHGLVRAFGKGVT